jgi:putative sigma-54 modulation protein
MRMHIHGKNIEVTEALKEYAERKLPRLDENGEAEIHVTLSILGHQPLHKVEATYRNGGLLIRAEEATEDMYASIDQVSAKLTGKFRRWKDKMKRRLKRSGIAALASENRQDEEENEGPFHVARVKQVECKPVDLQEAILEMNLLDHTFHLFLNKDTNQSEVVYRRMDGTYGLIRNSI